MKAWVVREKDEFCATVVFAETSGKAKFLALGTEPLENAEFCRLEARRAREFCIEWEGQMRLQGGMKHGIGHSPDNACGGKRVCQAEA